MGGNLCWYFSPQTTSASEDILIPMEGELTVTQLKTRWENILTVTNNAVAKHPGAYRELKCLLSKTVKETLDIKEYLPTAEKIVSLLEALDPCGHGSLFCLFNERFFPTNIRQVSELRLDCRDLLDHLKAFDEWRMNNCRLKVVK